MSCPSLAVADRQTRKPLTVGYAARCFEFARRWWLLSNDDDVQNALAVNCIEHLNFNDGKGQRAWAFDLLSPALQDAAVALGTAPHRQTDRRG